MNLPVVKTSFVFVELHASCNITSLFPFVFLYILSCCCARWALTGNTERCCHISGLHKREVVSVSLPLCCLCTSSCWLCPTNTFGVRSSHKNCTSQYQSTGFSQQLTVKGPCCFDGILPESHSFCLTPAVISFLYYYFFFFLAVDKATDYQNYYQGLWDCTGDQTDELTFKRGDPIYILSKVCLSFCLKVYLQNSLECKVKMNKIIQNKCNSPTIINSNCSRW